LAKIPRKYINRDISWLSFNERVLQEAADPVTPLIERFKFLGIFSSNLDEFFRVRVATNKRMVKAGRRAVELLGENPRDILNSIQQIVLSQQEKFDGIYGSILKELEKRKIFIIDDTQLTPEQGAYVRTFFQNEVRPRLVPIMTDDLERFPVLDDHSIYLAVRLLKHEDTTGGKHAIIEVPDEVLPRFVVLPSSDGSVHVILLDDVIRVGLESIFSMFGFKIFEAYTIKLTRDAELDIEDDITISFLEKVSKSLKKRESGIPVRFIFDGRIPQDFLKRLIKKNNLSATDTLIPGGRYHNFKDFMNFPAVGSPDLRYPALPPLAHPDIDPKAPLLSLIREKDILLHYPYQSFNYLIDLLREASIDPKVASIKISLYRLARNSNVVNALINAVRNGKAVTVVMELQARFDEEANIYWTDKLREEGVRLLYGVPDLKVHAKLLLISRREKGRLVNYANVSTGNFNEATARIYSDHSLCTADERITGEVDKIFRFFERNYKVSAYDSLIVSPFFMRKKLHGLINTEIKNARKGRKARILLKLNSLSDREMIDHLYEAGQAGVKVDLIVRGLCSLVPGVKGLSENIRAISIVDRFLEHTRIFVFHNGGDERYFISSADWMERNLDRRIEVICPIYDAGIKDELRQFLEIQLDDSTKARVLDAAQDNHYRQEPGAQPVRAQMSLYSHMKSRLK
jgi:polyphosphate kinase